tara:strand:- start:2918 stop:3124 length:207 start_codon:yes stop_codon:yes gene_type:complete
MKTNEINNPKHYTFGTIEPIQVIEDWNLSFNLGNVIKYVARSEHKGQRQMDLEKAVFYLQRELKNIKN